jgi:hypothetical protein
MRVEYESWKAVIRQSRRLCLLLLLFVKIGYVPQSRR